MHATSRKDKFQHAKFPVLAFVFVFVRGPLFRIEDLTALGWNRVHAWRTVMSLVRAGILEKYDRKSYGATEEARKWFRIAFGGGVNDTAFAYSAMAMESWGKPRLEYFKTKLTEMWEQRPERIRADPGRVGSSYGNDFPALAEILCEKMDEASYVWSLLHKNQLLVDHAPQSERNMAMVKSEEVT